MRKKHLGALIVSLVMAGTLLSTSSVRAQVGLPFGGLVSLPLPCTCSGNLWVWFTPLYLGGPVVMAGPMVYSPYFTILYANFRIGVPTTWHLGEYVPAVQACWIYVGWGCVPLPALGLMSKVGTN